MFRKAIIVGVLLVAVAAVSAGYASIPSANGVLSACKKGDGSIKLIDKEAGQACSNAQQLVEWNQQGPQGPAGPAGPGAAIEANQAYALGNSPNATTQFLTPVVQLSVAEGEKVHIVANKAFGTQAAPAGGLDLYPCYQLKLIGAPILKNWGGIWDNSLPANSRVTMGVNSVIDGLNGTYNFGMCGDDDGNGNWTSNDYGYVSVIKLGG
jgi:hypothetical protein